MDLKFRELIWDLDMDLGNFSRYYDKWVRRNVKNEKKYRELNI